ncbi:hypothetical protein EG835_13820, partial [bacterium]|nr:hypothetical protein [bacterium]
MIKRLMDKISGNFFTKFIVFNLAMVALANSVQILAGWVIFRDEMGAFSTALVWRAMGMIGVFIAVLIVLAYVQGR